MKGLRFFVQAAPAFLYPYLSNKLLSQDALGAEALHLERHVLFGLRVEGGVLDEAVHEHPDVRADLERLDVDSATLVLLLHRVHQLVHNLVSDVVHMPTTLTKRANYLKITSSPYKAYKNWLFLEMLKNYFFKQRKICIYRVGR